MHCEALPFLWRHINLIKLLYRPWLGKDKGENMNTSKELIERLKKENEEFKISNTVESNSILDKEFVLTIQASRTLIKESYETLQKEVPLRYRY